MPTFPASMSKQMSKDSPTHIQPRPISGTNGSSDLHLVSRDDMLKVGKMSIAEHQVSKSKLNRMTLQLSLLLSVSLCPLNIYRSTMKRDGGLAWWGTSRGRSWRRWPRISKNSWPRNGKHLMWAYLQLSFNTTHHFISCQFTYLFFLHFYMQTKRHAAIYSCRLLKEHKIKKKNCRLHIPFWTFAHLMSVSDARGWPVRLSGSSESIYGRTESR